MAKNGATSRGVRRAERASGRAKLRAEALRVLVLVIFLGFPRRPFNNHLKRTETQASEKQGNDYGALDVVVVVEYSALVDGASWMAGCLTRRRDSTERTLRRTEERRTF